MIKRLLSAAIAWIVVLAMVPYSAFAASFGISLTGTPTFNDSITVYVSLYGSQSAGGACGGICGIVANLSYDSSKIELVSTSPMQGFDFTQGTNLVLYKSSGAADGAILGLGFRNVSLSSGESTTISLSNVTGSNGDTDISAAGASISIQRVVPVQPTPTPQSTDNSGGSSSNANASNESQKSNTSSSTSSEKTETNNDSSESDEEEAKETESTKSSNASLKNISLDVGELEFDEKVLVYDVVVEDTVDKITIQAKTEDSKAKIAGVGEHELNYGLNVIKLTVTAEDGSTKEYTIQVYREETTITLSECNSKTKPYIIALIILGILLLLETAFIILDKTGILKLHITPKRKKKHSVV